MNAYFTTEQLLILIRLLFAHLLTDFVLQPSSWVNSRKEKKYKSPYLYLHGFVTAVVAYIFLADWNNFIIPIIILVTHTLIDLGKAYIKDNFVYFFLDQLLHVLVLIGCWIYLVSGLGKLYALMNAGADNPRVWLISFAYLVVTQPLGIMIGIATTPWRVEIESGEPERDSLNKAGSWIGIFERTIVLTLVLIAQYEAIGFLIAAKSILRFGDRNEDKPRKKTEYVLIGTLISFSLTILIGLILRALLKLS